MSGVSLLAARLKKNRVNLPSEEPLALQLPFLHEKTPKKLTNAESPPKQFGAVSTALARTYLVDKVLTSPKKYIDNEILRKKFDSWKFLTLQLRSCRNSGCSLLVSVLIRIEMRLMASGLWRLQKNSASPQIALTVSHSGHVEISKPPILRDFAYSRVALAAVYRPHIQKHIERIIKILAEP